MLRACPEIPEIFKCAPSGPIINFEFRLTYYPYSVPNTRHWNTYMSEEEVADNMKKKKAKKFKYIYQYDKNNLDLLFANIHCHLLMFSLNNYPE